MTLAMHPVLKRFLLISAKNAVNSVLINSALMLQWHSIFNFDNWPGVWSVTRATLSVIGAREVLVWVPKVMKWSQTDADPDAILQQSVDAAKTQARATVAAVKDVEAAAKDVHEAVQAKKETGE